jgi:hypothetical protein
MTMKQEAMRADFRALMTASGLPDYADDKNATQRVGNVIGKSAGHEERHIRSSDSRGRLTVDRLPDEHYNDGPNPWLWSVLLCTPVSTVVLLGVLAYWRFG